jgi:hypothetical protein
MLGLPAGNAASRAPPANLEVWVLRVPGDAVLGAQHSLDGSFSLYTEIKAPFQGLLWSSTHSGSQQQL